jgi:hypothetical protein
MCNIVLDHTDLNKNIAAGDQFLFFGPVDSVSDCAVSIQIQLVDQPKDFLNQNITQSGKSAGK